MIIWGWKGKEHKIHSGQFFCPNCMADAGYDHMRVSRYFTLYFIPLFPTSTLGQYVRCGACKAELKEVVLQWTREQILQATQPWTCGKCNNRNPGSQLICLGCGTSNPSQPVSLPSSPPPLPQLK
jgi:hypothetical protein